MLRRSLLATVFAVAPALAFAQGGLQASAVSMVETAGHKMVDLINAPGASGEQKRRQAAALLRQYVDLNGVSRFVLGRYARGADQAALREFQTTFEEWIVRNLASRFGELAGVTFQIARTLPRDEGAVEVQTLVAQSGKQPAILGWRVENVGGAPKIVDLVAEGSSLRLTTRSEYSSFLGQNNGDLGKLTARLRQQLAALTEREGQLASR